MNKDKCFSVYAIRPPKEIEKIIMGSSKLMQSKRTFDKKAYIENFTKTQDMPKKCHACRFKAIC